MDQSSIRVTPGDYFLLRKQKIREEIKLLKDFVQQYKNIPEMKNKIMDYLQSLRGDLQDIESLVQHGEPFVSSNHNGTNLHHGQEMTQRNAFFGSTLYQESDVVMSSNAQSLLCSKRKRWSPVQEDFTKYVGENGKEYGKEWAKCNHCKREFGGSSKSGTTYFKNYLKSCSILRTLDRVADKEKKKSVIGQELNGFNWVQRTINYELSDIKDDILVVYEQEKCELCGFLDKLPSHFGIRIEGFQYDNWYMEIYFVDESWELRNTIIYFNDGDYDHEIMKSVLVDWNIHKKIFFVITDHEEDDVVAENLKTWFSKRGILHLIEQYLSGPFSLSDLWLVSLCELNEISPSKILTKASYLRDYVSEPSNAQSFDNAVTEATSKGKMVTSQSVPQSRFPSEILLEWTVGCKEAFCELEHIDPKSISFTKKDWDDATLMYSCWQVLKDLKKEEINNLSDEIHFFLRLDQLRMSEDSFLRIAASWCQHHIVRNWKSFGMVIDISVILDPRSTMEMVKRYYKIIYGNDAEADLHKMIDDVIIFFNYYVKGTSSSSSSHHTILELELKRYLKEEHPQDKGFDILQWWRDKSPIYPTLARMARDLLSIPYELSCLKFYLRDKIKDVFNCTTLDDDFKKKLACTKNWLYTSGNN